MAETVSQHLDNVRPRLLRKLEQNNELCKTLAGLLGLVVIESQRRGVSVENVNLSPLRTLGDGMFGARIDYFYRGLQVPAGFGEKGTFEEYLAAKGVQLAKVLALNHSVSRFFESLVEAVDRHAMDKGVRFSELHVMEDGAFISKDDELVIKVVSQKQRWKLLETFKRYGKK